MAQKKTAPKKKPSGGAKPKKSDAQRESDALVATSGVTRKTLEKTPGRILKLLRGFTAPAVERALAPLGFGQATVDEGWELLRAASGYSRSKEASTSPEVEAAVRQLDAMDEKVFRQLRGSLRAQHGAILAKITEGIAPAEGFEAVLNMKVISERLDDLEKAASKDKAAKAALAQLAENGIDAATRGQWKELLKAAGTITGNVSNESDARELARVKALIAARDYWLRWADFAASVVTRKDLLIRLGLATRKSPEEQEKDEEDLADDDEDAEDEPHPQAKPAVDKKPIAGGNGVEEADG